MKITTQISAMGLLSLSLVTPFSMAGEVAGTAQYQSGDTLTAQSLNDNFSAIVSEVNDNNVRLTTLEEGATAASVVVEGYAARITALEEDTGATNLVVDDHADRINVLELEQGVVPGAVSIGHRVFTTDNQLNDAGLCNLYRGPSNYAYFSAVGDDASADCDAGTSIQLPHGRTLTELRCTVLDNTDLVSLNAKLWRTDLTTGASSNIFTTDNTVDDTNVVVMSTADVNTSGSDLVDNTRYAYNLFINFDGKGFNTIGLKARIYGCSVSYE
ncbi:MAG: hypothetical protein VW258_05515 [Thalassolituus sp.]